MSDKAKRTIAEIWQKFKEIDEKTMNKRLGYIEKTKGKQHEKQ